MTAEAQPPTGATDAFVAELKRWRDVRGLSQTVLAKKVGYTPSYVSKVESGQQRPSRTGGVPGVV
jgi:predicted transcriptional regulator